ncbi:MAG: hypothetical protein PHP02_06645 [Eubacteriales bacterium]|nr:hypothetical protein [Eubacteriales bacterium]
MKPDKSHGQDSPGLAEAQVADLEGALESTAGREKRCLRTRRKQPGRRIP